jgi:hypothetical protein
MGETVSIYPCFMSAWTDDLQQCFSTFSDSQMSKTAVGFMITDTISVSFAEYK